MHQDRRKLPDIGQCHEEVLFSVTHVHHSPLQLRHRCVVVALGEDSYMSHGVPLASNHPSSLFELCCRDDQAPVRLGIVLDANVQQVHAGFRSSLRNLGPLVPTLGRHLRTPEFEELVAAAHFAYVLLELWEADLPITVCVHSIHQAVDVLLAVGEAEVLEHGLDLLLAEAGRILGLEEVEGSRQGLFLLLYLLLDAREDIFRLALVAPQRLPLALLNPRIEGVINVHEERVPGLQLIQRRPRGSFVSVSGVAFHIRCALRAPDAVETNFRSLVLNLVCGGPAAA
mmetsp:Transcript_12392/g.36114  ORF Transcript_12392/g.36114 Transcript_12392/m.36114 type:complete len:285 (-) Transcript_12392:119-973(-)